jgi:Beta-lactamase
MRARDRFRVGSITKPFVATVVLQLAGEHKLTLADTVERWLPARLPDGERISVRQLLTPDPSSNPRRRSRHAEYSDSWTGPGRAG